MTSTLTGAGLAMDEGCWTLSFTIFTVNLQVSPQHSQVSGATDILAALFLVSILILLLHLWLSYLFLHKQCMLIQLGSQSCLVSIRIILSPCAKDAAGHWQVWRHSSKSNARKMTFLSNCLATFLRGGQITPSCAETICISSFVPNRAQETVLLNQRTLFSWTCIRSPSYHWFSTCRSRVAGLPSHPGM